MNCGFYKLLCPAAFTLLGVMAACSSDSAAGGTSDEPRPEDSAEALAIIDSWDETAINLYDTAYAMPDDNCIKLVIRNKALNLRKEFRDSNYRHYEAGERLGIEPIHNDSSFRAIKKPLIRMTSNKLFVVDPMTHAYPYLIPEARDLLNEITKRFHDSLMARGGGDYRPRVTSMLRTSGTIQKLRRVNRASVDSSSHRFGTTFDISYTRFAWGGDDSQPRRTQEDLKNLLGEVLYDLRQEGRCLVIFERRPGCFHITTLPSSK